MATLPRKFAWYVNRLRCMSAAEMVYRFTSKLEARLQQLGFFTCRSVVTPNLEREGVRWFAGTKEVDSDPVCRLANRILAGHFPVFAVDDVDVGSIPCWNRDPLTGVIAPMTFGPGLDVQNPDKVGNIKYLWELNRHLHLVTVAQAYHLTSESRYLKGLAGQIGSWLEQCPYLKGPSWSSSLEAGIRLINWAIIWQLIGGKNACIFNDTDGESLRQRWLVSIFQHCHFIAGHQSRFSSANNHLIGEAAGLYIASMTWPYWNESFGWSDLSYEILAKEVANQVTADGVDREQAIAYHQFVLDFLMLAGQVARAADRDFPVSYWNTVESMLEYIAAIMDINGHVPMLGDADDGRVVRLDTVKDCPYKSLLATGGVLFSRFELLAKAQGLDDKTRWMLGDQATEVFCKTMKEVRGSPRREFPDGGYYILGADLESASEIRCIVDAGSLGYLSIAAHGHADALAVTLSVAGREILVDTGTYAYHGKDKWRQYFRGTSAHNTVRVDGVDQSVSGGKFMWIRHAVSRCDRWEDDADHAAFSGSHNGYLRLDDPVTHTRKINLDKKNRCMEVVDVIEAQSEHQIERIWHFSEECDVTINDGCHIVVINGDQRLTIHLHDPHDTDVRAYYGSDDPVFGWISRNFDSKVPAITVVECATVAGAARFGAEFRLN